MAAIAEAALADESLAKELGVQRGLVAGSPEGPDGPTWPEHRNSNGQVN